jgi:hypothetical protein
MHKKLVIAILSVAFATILGFTWSVVRHQSVDDPESYAKLELSIEDPEGWPIYTNDRYGFELRYPPNYQVVKDQPDYVALRQNGDAAGDPDTIGKRIGLRVYDLASKHKINVGEKRFALDGTTTLDGIEQLLAEDAGKPANRAFFNHRRRFDGHDAIISIVRATGEMPLLTGGLYKVDILGMYETTPGRRVLIAMSNDAGGTPHLRDRTLRRDLLQMYSTLRWK